MLTMLTRKASLLRRRNRAVTLIEAVLYISIALALIVGGLVFYQQASTAARTNTLVRELSATVAETKALVKGMALSDVPNNISAYLIAAGAVPPDMVESATTLSTAFGPMDFYAGIFNQDAASLYIGINLTNIPQSVCVRLLTASARSSPPEDWYNGGVPIGGTTLIASGLLLASVAQDNMFWDRAYVMTATEAGWMCKYGSRTYTSQTTEPTSAPLSGNVDVSMTFLTNL